MKKGSFLKRRNLKKFTRIVIVVLIFLILISSSTISVKITENNISETIEPEKFKEVISNGLAPKSEVTINNPNEKSSDTLKDSIDPFGEIMYGYNAYPGPEGTIYFDVDDPGTIQECGETISGDFLAGGTFGCDDIWYACQNGNGLLYGIDPYNDCEMWVIGGGGTGMNGLAYDPTNNRMYGSGDDNYLYEIDPDTGEQDQIGAFGSGVIYMIGMAFNPYGVLYGWDLSDRLWTIDTETGEATEVGDLGINLNYAQDGDFHRESHTLYLTAYTTTGQLYTVDIEIGEASLIGDFEDGMEITASIFLNCCFLIQHDISLVSIDSPQTGRAEPDMDMEITVKNMGNNTETFDAQMEIIKNQSIQDTLLDENFSGTFPPEGWETEYWSQCDECSCSSDPPCACINSFPCEYCDFSITSKAVNASEYKKCNVRFRWSGDYYYPQYCNLYVKFRTNENGSWKDVTPWDNPVGENQDGEIYEIGIYGTEEEGCGEALQIKWEYFGYYYYFNNLCLDTVTIEGGDYYYEYVELVEDITLDPGEKEQIEFPPWTPSDWQNESTENTWEEYPVHAFVLLSGDQNPRNDKKTKNIDLWYPWMHDIEIMSIDSPHSDGESLPGQTFPVQATIRNVGQYAECCIPIDMNIGNSYLIDTLMAEYDWPGVTNPYGSSYQMYFPGYDNGWRDDHKNISYYYGWRRYYGSYSGGSPYEAYLPYYYAKQDYHFYIGPIDASEYQMLRLRFLSLINHNYGEGLYSLEAGYSFDGETWYAAWHEEPSSSGGYDIDVPIEGGSENLYIGFWIKGDPYYFNYWYIDNVELVSLGYTEEYSDSEYHGADIEPGEEVTFTFEDWTPERLSDETSGSEDYIVEAIIEMDGDRNPGNDIKTEELTLDFWHDVGIDEIISPIGEGHSRARDGDELLWDNGEPDGRDGLPGSMYQGYSNIIIDDFQIEEPWNIQGGAVHFFWDGGFTSNTDTIRVYFYKDEGNCNPSLDEYPEPDMYFEASQFTEYTTGNYYFGRPEVVVDFLLEEEPKILCYYDWFVGIQLDGITDDIAYILTAPDKGCMAMADLPYWGYPRWTSSQDIFGEEYDLSWQLHGNTGCGPCYDQAWIKPGIQDIDIIVRNYGTFEKENLICYAEIWEFITDPLNETKVYSDQIYGIDLLTPLGGTEYLQFEDFLFADEGIYLLILDFPAEPDDYKDNNERQLYVNVDDTEPISEYPPILNPQEPNGNNGWYVDNVEVTLNATDPRSNEVSSGVREIRYTINGGAEQVIPYNKGSFVLTDDGNDILIEYWAVDFVGNVESPKNSFTIDIDQTVPDINLNYEVGGNQITGWKLKFIAKAIDSMSGMDCVEFYFNEVLQETIIGPGPEYYWTFAYIEDITFTITAIAYDKAGNYFSDKIENPTISAQITPKNSQTYSKSYQLLQIPHVR